MIFTNRISILSFISIVLCGLCGFGLLSGCNGDEPSVSSAQIQIKEQVCVGMDLDIAITSLRKEGFRVGEKYRPTKNADYYQVNVVLRDKIPGSETVKYVLGLSSKKRSYLVVKASLDGKILAIE